MSPEILILQEILYRFPYPGNLVLVVTEVLKLFICFLPLALKVDTVLYI